MTPSNVTDFDYRRFSGRNPNRLRRDVVPIGPVRRVVRGTLTLTIAAVLTACGSSPLSGPSNANLIGTQDGRAAGPSGLEQRLTAQVESAPIGSPYTAQLTITSTIVNTGSATVSLTARECLFQDADVETTARMDRFEPFISCGAVSSARDLAPGQSSSSMQVQFGVRSGSGTYTVKLRHALSPEFRGEVSFRIP
jgi:hypothetical protein